MTVMMLINENEIIVYNDEMIVTIMTLTRGRLKQEILKVKATGSNLSNHRE